MKKIEFSTVKTITWVFAILLIFYIFYNLYLFLKALFNKVKESPLEYNISNCRISDSDAKNQADELKSAMFLPTTNEKVVFSILADKNKDELIQLYNQFGTRLYINWFIAGFAKTVRYITLFRWFEEEFEGTELERLKNIWKKTSIPW